MKYLRIVLFILSACSITSFAQNWQLGGNASPPLNGTNNILGTNSNFPIRIQTNNIIRAQFTTNTGIPAGYFGVGGDGIRIFSTVPSPVGNLDIWTTSVPGTAGETHIKWDGFGQIGASGHWFRIWSNANNGMDFNVIKGTGRYLFRRDEVETGRIGTNNFWRIGL